MGSLARQATINSVLSYVGLGIGFVNIVLLYPRVLPADQFGLTRLLVSMAAVIAQVAQLGLDNTVIRYFPYFRNADRRHHGLLGIVLLLVLGGGLLAMALLGAFHNQLAQVFADRNGLYLAHGLWLLPLVLSEVFFIALRAYSRSLRRSVQPTFIREFVLRVLQMALIVAQWKLQLPFDGFMALYSLVFAVCTALLIADLWRAGHWMPGLSHLRMPRRLRRSMSTFGIFSLSSSLAVIVLGNLDQMMIGALLRDGLQYVAYYAVAYYFGTVIAVPSRSINQLALPMLADAWRTRDMATIARLYRTSALVQLVIGAFLFLLIWANLDDLFLMLPAEYAIARDVVVVIAMANLFNIALGLNGGIISMSRSYRFDAATSLLLLISNVVTGFFLIRAMGMVGAAWATLISLVMMNLARLVFLYRRYALFPFTARTLLAVALPVLMALAIPWMPSLGRPVWDIALRTAVITIAYWPAIHVLRVAPEISGLFKRFGGQPAAPPP